MAAGALEKSLQRLRVGLHEYFTQIPCADEEEYALAGAASRR